MNSCGKRPYITTLGGRITCPRCQAASKQTGNQCRAPASKGKMQCRFHGGKSTGPKTDAGKLACAAARTTQGGRETREQRRVRAEKFRELKELEGLLKLKGLLT